jgi:TPR repeat protein
MDIIHAAGRIFVTGAFTPSIPLETMANVRLAILTELTKQLKRMSKFHEACGANDAASIYMLATHYYNGRTGGLQQDRTKAIELFEYLGYKKAHNNLSGFYYEGGDMKKAKFHFEAAAMAGHEVARYNLGILEANSGNKEQAVKHWKIDASAGHHKAMHDLLIEFKEGALSRETINTTLTAYNNSCAEMMSEARDAYI